MLALYLASFGFGAVLLGVSVFFGGADKDFDKDLDLEADGDADLDHDGDVDHDGDAELDGEAEVDGEADAEADHDGDGDGGSGLSSLGDLIWLPIFSMRFWSFGAAAFGFVGTALTLGSLHWLLVLALAIGLGAVSGTLAAWFFRQLKKDSVSGATTFDRMVGEDARVRLPVEAGGTGTIVWNGPAGAVELLAITRDALPIPVGATVIIAGVRDGVADVSALPPDPEHAARARRQASRKRQST